MSRHTQGSMAIVGAIGAGIFAVAFIALMVLGKFGFSAALFLAILIAALATIVLYLGFGSAPSVPSSEPVTKAAPAPTVSSGAATATDNADADAAQKAEADAETARKAEADAEAARKAEADAEAARKADAEKAAAASAATQAASGDSKDYDGDGVIEGADEGVRPAGLDGPRDGKADDLKQIKGIGPKLEKLCNKLGFWHFDQVANWSADEVAWVDANLEGFKGRVTRDEWVSQANILAGGGETEFSKKVEDGDVY